MIRSPRENPRERILENLLERISLAGAECEAFEASNLESDLRAVLLRLESGEYRQADFLVRNVFDLARRTREYYSYFASWREQAARWASILRKIPFDLSADMIDLCPGWAPKVELALLEMGFRGKVHLIDKNAEASRALIGFVSMFSPRFAIEAVEVDLLAPLSPSAGVGEEWPRASLVVGNHLLDDVLFDRWASRLGFDVDRIYEDEAVLRTAWREVLSNFRDIESEYPRELAQALTRYVKPGGHLVLCHYASLAERLLGTNEIREAFSSLFRATRRELALSGLHEVHPAEESEELAKAQDVIVLIRDRAQKKRATDIERPPPLLASPKESG